MAPFHIRDIEKALGDRLASQHGVELITTDRMDGTLHRFDNDSGTFRLASRLSVGQRAFRMAAELGFLEAGTLIDKLVDEEPFTSDASINLAKRGIANYFAAATLLPYGLIHGESEKSGYDVEYLCNVFGVGYETVAVSYTHLRAHET